MLHAALAAALRGEPFPHLGNSPLAAAAVRTGGRLPWSLVRRVYTRVGASEGVDPDRLGDVDLAAVARWLGQAAPLRPLPQRTTSNTNRVGRRDRLGGLLHEYQQAARHVQRFWHPQTSYCWASSSQA